MCAYSLDHITAKFLGYMATNKPTTLRFKSFRTRLSLTTHFDKISSKTLATSTLSKNEHQASYPGLYKIVCAYHSIDNKTGGASRDRTDDPLLAKQVLSQLSYGPVVKTLVGLGGLEPPTSPLSGARSNHLSYRPSALSKAASFGWWSLSGSNR